jgi:hypothetical protein
MVARKSFFRLKSISVSSEFRSTYDNEVLPVMRSEPGFLGALTLANPGSLERIVVTLWETKRDMDFYNVNLYPKVLKILADTISGTPKVHTFDAVNFAPHDGKTDPEAALAVVE